MLRISLKNNYTQHRVIKIEIFLVLHLLVLI